MREPKVDMLQAKDLVVTAEEYYGDLSKLDNLMALQDGSEEYWEWPGDVSSGFFYIIKLRSGIVCTITTHQSSTPIAVEFTEKLAGFIVSFVVNGNVLVGFDRSRYCRRSVEDLRFTPSLGYLSYMPGSQGVVHLPREYSCYLTIGLEPWVFQTFWDEEFSGVSLAIDSILQAPGQQEFHHPFVVSPLMNMRLHEIFNCCYQGSSKRYFLEGKVLELIVLTLNQLKDGSSSPLLPRPRRQTNDFVFQARDILLNNMAEPPSLTTLSKQVGVNKNKLNQCFRQTYGSSIFQFLRICRLEKSKELLLDGEKNVNEVALAVGYSQQSSFTWEFKKYFGVSPKNYLKSKA